jgi:type IV pilus assembly protein PilP
MMGNRPITRFCLVLFVFLLLSVMSGCSEDPVVTQTPAPAITAKATVPKAPLEVTEDVEDDEPQRFVYSPTGRRDPFESLIKNDIKPKNSEGPLTPLQKYDIGQFRLQAVLIGKGAPRAMVGAPDGKTYILTPGIKIGKREGVVKEITRESVLIEEVHYDMVGAVTRKLATIEMPEQKSF